MATAKQIREQNDLQAVRDRAHAAALREASFEEIGCGIDAVVAVLREKSENVLADNRKGAKSLAASLSAAADHVAGLGALLDANPAPTSSGPNPHREPLAEIPLHMPTGDSRGWLPDLDPDHVQVELPTLGASVFGEGWPNDAATRAKLDSLEDVTVTIGGTFDAATPGEVVTMVKSSVEAKREPLVHITANGVHEWYGLPREAITLCGADAPALRTYRGGANCPDCIVVFDRTERPTLATAQVNVPSPGAMQLFRDNAAAIEEMALGENSPITEQEKSAIEARLRPTLAAPKLSEPPTNTVAPKRMTLIEVAEHGRARQRGAEHRSYSQISAFEECGVRYALSDRESTPAWWNVGGNAVHSAIEAINRETMRTNGLPTSKSRPFSEYWPEAFTRTVAEVEQTSGIPHAHWRAAAKGSEAYDWWRVEGEAMVARWWEYLRERYDAGWKIVEVERELSLPVDGVPVPVTAILDVVLYHPGRDWWRIIDIKAGKSAPREGFQIGGLYHWALWVALQPDADLNISQAFWLARTGEEKPVATTPWPEVVHRVATMDASERQGHYIARPGVFCGSCEVNALCPSGPQ